LFLFKIPFHTAAGTYKTLSAAGGKFLLTAISSGKENNG
jgi:hypothetical protein